MEQRRAVVVGAGIGGLTAAVALHRDGWQVTVLERAADLAPVGAGIGLAPNSQRALDVIGLGDRVRELAAWQGDGGMRTPDGRWLARTDAKAAAARFGGPLVLLHRATLVEILTSALPEGTIRTGAAATLADPGDDHRPARLTTPEGEIEAELVVAADGIRSAIRHALFPEHPGTRYAGCTTWRVVVPAPARPFAPHETWGAGRLWGTQPLKDGRVYAYAMAAAPAGGRAPDDERAELLRLFGDWHHPVPEILAAVDPGQVLRHDVHHLPDSLPAFHRGRVALLGDAAHAMMPSLGQGGNQAIEDAVVLAHHARSGPGFDPAGALAAYTADRLPRTTAIVRKAARTGAVTLLSARPAVALRSALVGAVSRFGPGLVLRGFDGIADWRPPVAPARPA
ncbi:monooxygenase [Streptomyces venezuelae]|uniref:FAD-dependent monooxygenase n=1 Tax=Streptomyces gardneri TaxID=66892 RepID=UPI0006E378CD|nr:FAD-dependent monooxygenase [Streptomyces gardneri]ALO06901.1 monooxygenase [Streptomyces venezuelae]QPK44278.1 FAD-dependent monooxygenase [Streptomyces gardneri]WRK35567.1 FAD-dependent monooxygenase [Streptomyces venezuelae]